MPAVDVPVTLTVNGNLKVVRTDANGRARFEGIAAKAHVRLSLPSTAPELALSTFVMAETGGIRLVMSSAKWRSPPLPSARDFSGKPRPDPEIPAGTLEVKLTYDNLGDPKPPAGVVVKLVGYAADGTITVASKQTDAKGVAQFTGLDRTEHVAYYPTALLPRDGKLDRLATDPILLAPSAGAHVVLSSYARTSKEPPIDLEPVVVPRGKVLVALLGPPDPAATIEIIDATTGKQIGGGPANGAETQLALTSTAMIYAQTKRGSQTYRSRTVPAISERGVSLKITIAPRMVETFRLLALVDDNFLGLQLRLHLANYSWHPTQGGHDLPLPVGFQGLVIRDEDAPYVKPTSRGVRLDAPLPPGGRSVIVGVSLPITNQRAKVVMEVPFGTLDSSIQLKADPGVTFVDLPPTISPKLTDTFLHAEGISIAPNKSLQFSVTAPTPDPKQIAIKKACKDLAPNVDSPLLGKPLVDFTAPLLDGKPFRLSSLKGKPVFVTFNASWNSVRDDHKTLPALVKQLGGELVTVLSDTDRAAVTKAFGVLPGRVVLDKPAEIIGPVTSSWGINVVPETYVVDRNGIIKFHLINQRDWSLPSTLACLKTGI